MLPPLAKYHAPPSGEGLKVRDAALRDCRNAVDDRSVELEIERQIHDEASAKLDATFAELRAAGVDVDALMRAFTSHLDAAMTMGARHMTKALGLTTNAGSDTLIMDVCFRQCAIDALHSAVKLEYPGPPAPREKRHDHAAHHQTAIHHDPPLEVVDG